MTKQVLPSYFNHVTLCRYFKSCLQCSTNNFCNVFLDKMDADKPVVIDVDDVKVKEEKEDSEKKVCLLILDFVKMKIISVRELLSAHVHLHSVFTKLRTFFLILFTEHALKCFSKKRFEYFSMPRPPS